MFVKRATEIPVELGKDTDRLVEWEDMWQMKNEVIHFGGNNTKKRKMKMDFKTVCVESLASSLIPSGWPSGLRRSVQVAVSSGGVGSNPTPDIDFISFARHQPNPRNLSPGSTRAADAKKQRPPASSTARHTPS